jgi:hypothetical protein
MLPGPLIAKHRAYERRPQFHLGLISSAAAFRKPTGDDVECGRRMAVQRGSFVVDMSVDDRPFPLIENLVRALLNGLHRLGGNVTIVPRARARGAARLPPLSWDELLYPCGDRSMHALMRWRR